MADSPQLVGTHPVIPVRNMTAALAFYQDKLGFTRVFDDAPGPDAEISYAGVRRGGVCLHLQTMAPDEDPTMPLIRIDVQNIDQLFEEYTGKGVISPDGKLEAKPWGSRDFGVYDVNGAALVFFEDLPTPG